MLWINNIIGYIYLGFLHTEMGLGVSALVLSALLVLFEVKTFFTDYRVYFQSLWNLFDLVAFLFFIFVVIHNMATDEEAHTVELANVWFRFISVLLLSVRSLVWLRVFSPTRYMVTMVLEVFNDFAPILIILAVILLIYGYTWRLAPSLTSGGSSEGEMDFYNSFLNAVNLIFGNAPDPLGGDGQERFAVIVFVIY